jgi:RNA polymerase sigma-70 factor (ECF subfamily)
MVSDDAEFYRKHCDEFARFATALVGPSGADDLVATAVTRSIATDSWQGVSNTRAYVYRAMLNESMRSRRDVQRRLARERRVAQGEASSDHSVDLDVLNALVRLSVRQRAVLFLTYWLDLPRAEVAALIGSSERTVERELAAGKRRLKEYLQ